MRLKDTAHPYRSPVDSKRKSCVTCGCSKDTARGHLIYNALVKLAQFCDWENFNR